MAGVHQLTPVVGNAAACHALGLWRGTLARGRARSRRAALLGPPAPRPALPPPPLALTPCEQQVLLGTLNSERFVDTAPAAVHATLLDEGHYLGSVRTMYRLLAANGGCHERRNQRRHAVYSKPELLAVAPNFEMESAVGLLLLKSAQFVTEWFLSNQNLSEEEQEGNLLHDLRAPRRMTCFDESCR
ncbi:MAG: hypothetical protein AB7F22_35790 [Reyranella sp.]|uniref:hypothetical protein n=1 Tax=Reyranella sp. TaxID=1929291 RepID=UPI003D0B142F